MGFLQTYEQTSPHNSKDQDSIIIIFLFLWETNILIQKKEQDSNTNAQHIIILPFNF